MYETVQRNVIGTWPFDGYIVVDTEDLWTDDRACRAGRTPSVTARACVSTYGKRSVDFAGARRAGEA